jgi:hypothetical protein
MLAKQAHLSHISSPVFAFSYGNLQFILLNSGNTIELIYDCTLLIFCGLYL